MGTQIATQFAFILYSRVRQSVKIIRNEVMLTKDTSLPLFEQMTSAPKHVFL
jgi:hypothetical protein